ncbi:hypothetical protein BDA99DRAFT_109873 [Phascolomyces articulosus]|uniref:Uncharacterized protein n=1 Tax=Phascolomyces articulosus TaxID=60185 RepID=A0AAD5PCK7_9FUNG|nr:hypothetical protein BDA99DRAFT_109873 [Phascolomyces articulosus]
MVLWVKWGDCGRDIFLFLFLLYRSIITAATIAVVRADVFMNIAIYVLQGDALTLETGNDLLENESFVIYLQ